MAEDELYRRAIAAADRARLEGFYGTENALIEIAQTLLALGLDRTTSQVAVTSAALEELS